MTDARVWRVPGDKSISHRALILAALGDGRSRIRGVLRSADVRSTAGVLRALGVAIPPLDVEELVIDGANLRGLSAPDAALDCGNSGTTARLMAGVVAASPMSAIFIGDASLSRRPMRRVARPLEALGARVELGESGGLPMTVHGARLRGTTWHSEVASAQVKSAILLAAMIADIPVEVHEPLSTRDHTERMLQARGIDLRVDGNVVALVPGRALGAADVDVPADPSSAFFLAARAACDPSHPVLLTDVCLNPHRIGAFRVLRRMGAEVHFERVREAGGEPVGDVRVAAGTLRSAVIEAEEIPSLVDELPMLAALASRGSGTLEVRGAGELRVKESDRIATVVANLRAVGARAEEQPDGFVVEGSAAALSGAVVTQGDHRIAMAFGVLSSLPGHAIAVDDRACADVSFPGFWECMEAMRG